MTGKARTFKNIGDITAAAVKVMGKMIQRAFFVGESVTSVRQREAEVRMSTIRDINSFKVPIKVPDIKTEAKKTTPVGISADRIPPK